MSKNEEWARMLRDQKKLLENVHWIEITEVIRELSQWCNPHGKSRGVRGEEMDSPNTKSPLEKN